MDTFRNANKNAHFYPLHFGSRQIKLFFFLVCFFSQNYFARNFYNMRLLALFVAFAINFILLFYKVCAILIAIFSGTKIILSFQRAIDLKF